MSLPKRFIHKICWYYLGLKMFTYQIYQYFLWLTLIDFSFYYHNSSNH